MARDLEKLTQKRGIVWMDWELLLFVYEEVREIPMKAAVSQLRESLSSAALASIQEAAGAVVASDPDADYFGGGWITPEAPATMVSAPMEFARFLAANLVPTPNT